MLNKISQKKTNIIWFHSHVEFKKQLPFLLLDSGPTHAALFSSENPSAAPTPRLPGGPDLPSAQGRGGSHPPCTCCSTDRRCFSDSHRQGWPHKLLGPAQNKNVHSLFKKQEKSGFLSCTLTQPVMVFFNLLFKVTLPWSCRHLPAGYLQTPWLLGVQPTLVCCVHASEPTPSSCVPRSPPGGTRGVGGRKPLLEGGRRWNLKPLGLH